ncbi:hypothetical protein N431DRAFT_461191 [Stipitochalara longipes BDJ]|nr:hypothetical protein N431DRAFT_461191 [Stipitochalara longipes BDJ]
MKIMGVDLPLLEIGLFYFNTPYTSTPSSYAIGTLKANMLSTDLRIMEKDVLFLEYECHQNDTKITWDRFVKHTQLRSSGSCHNSNTAAICCLQFFISTFFIHVTGDFWNHHWAWKASPWTKWREKHGCLDERLRSVAYGKTKECRERAKPKRNEQRRLVITTGSESTAIE